MIEKFRKQKDEELESQIESVYKSLDLCGPDEEGYSELLTLLERLNKMKRGSARRINPDTIAVVAGNLLGILIVVAYEQTHVMTSKAFSTTLQNAQTGPKV